MKIFNTILFNSPVQPFTGSIFLTAVGTGLISQGVYSLFKSGLKDYSKALLGKPGVIPNKSVPLSLKTLGSGVSLAAAGCCVVALQTLNFGIPLILIGAYLIYKSSALAAIQQTLTPISTQVALPEVKWKQAAVGLGFVIAGSCFIYSVALNNFFPLPVINDSKIDLPEHEEQSIDFNREKNEKFVAITREKNEKLKSLVKKNLEKCINEENNSPGHIKFCTYEKLFEGNKEVISSYIEHKPRGGESTLPVRCSLLHTLRDSIDNGHIAEVAHRWFKGFYIKINPDDKANPGDTILKTISWYSQQNSENLMGEFVFSCNAGWEDEMW